MKGGIVLNKKSIQMMSVGVALCTVLTGCGNSKEPVAETPTIQEEVVLPEISAPSIRNDSEEIKQENNQENINSEKIETTTKPTKPAENQRYGGSDYFYNKLTDREQKIYLAVEDSIINFKEDVIIPEMTKQELFGEYFKKIYLAAFNDNPQVFIQPKVVELIENYDDGTMKIKFNFDPHWTASNIASGYSEIDKEVAKIRKKLDTLSSDYHKVLWLHQNLVKEIEYTHDYPWSSGMYGALVKKQASCEGITEAFQYILALYDIETIGVVGTSGFETKNGGNHKWCMVKLDGEWYYFDVTWDIDKDLSMYLPFSYFAVDEKYMSIAHSPWYKDMLPKATATKYNYYIYNNLTVDKYSKKAVIKAAQDSYKLTPGFITMRFSNPTELKKAFDGRDDWVGEAFQEIGLTKWRYWVTSNPELCILEIGLLK